MCAIAGVSFAPDSKINRRKLTNALLTAGQVRGRDAGGYAWVNPNGDGMYKRDVPPSQLSVSRLPEDATAIIVHTRAATHGSPRDNDNNHPVVSPGGNIRLVHNGVIWNHEDVRRSLGKVGKRLPDVDSSVIPAVIEELGLGNVDLLEGDAACAWFDTETGDVIHLARFQHSPVAVAELEDGSTVFASTPEILAEALDRVGLRWFGVFPGPFRKLKESEYLQIIGGDIINESTVDWGDEYGGYTSYGWRSTTDGGESRAVTGGWTDELDDEDYWPVKGGESQRPAVLTDPMTSKYNHEDIPPVFWVEEHNGNRQEFVSLTTLKTALAWHSGIGAGEYDLVDDEHEDLRWVNHFQDIGEIDLDSGEYISWVSKPNEMQDYGASIPGYIRDGIDVLRRVLS